MSERTKHQERRSLALLGAAALTFLAVQQLGGWLLRVRWPEVRFAGLEAMTLKARAASKRPVVVFLGSSRTGCGIRAEDIAMYWSETAGPDLSVPIKLALPACDPLAMEYIYDRVDGQGLQAAAVVLEISPETLADRCYWLNYHVHRQLGWPELLALAGELGERKLLRPCLLGQALPLWKFRFAIRHELLRALLPQLPPRDASVLEGNEALVEELNRLLARRQAMPLNERVEEGLGPLRRWFSAREYRVGGANFEALRQLVAQLQRRGIPTILLDMPVCSAQRALYSPLVEARYQAGVVALLAQYPGLIRVDARALCSDEEFSDNHHLTASGAARLSQHLAYEIPRRLQSPGAQKPWTVASTGK